MEQKLIYKANLTNKQKSKSIKSDSINIHEKKENCSKKLPTIKIINDREIIEYE